MNRPSDSVRIALFDRDNPSEFLIVTEADDPENWKLTGGKFDTAHETPVQAAERELYEELTLVASNVGLRAVGRLMNDDGISARHILVGMVRRRQVVLSAEMAKARWVGEATIPAGENQAHIRSAVQLARTALG